jgi:hypothetical protein
VCNRRNQTKFDRLNMQQKVKRKQETRKNNALWSLLARPCIVCRSPYRVTHDWHRIRPDLAWGGVRVCGARGSVHARSARGSVHLLCCCVVLVRVPCTRNRNNVPVSAITRRSLRNVSGRSLVRARQWMQRDVRSPVVTVKRNLETERVVGKQENTQVSARSNVTRTMIATSW